LSQLFPRRDHLEIFGHQDIASARETDDSRSATNSPDIITNRIGCGDTK